MGIISRGVVRLFSIVLAHILVLFKEKALIAQWAYLYMCQTKKHETMTSALRIFSINFHSANIPGTPGEAKQVRKYT